MNRHSHPSRPDAIAFSALRLFTRLALIVLSLFFLAGCGKKDASAEAKNRLSALQENTASDSAEIIVIPPPENGDVNVTLAQLTRELRHTMVGRKLNRDFDEFVALCRVQAPSPPPGKKYAISGKWTVILVDK